MHTMQCCLGEYNFDYRYPFRMALELLVSQTITGELEPVISDPTGELGPVIKLN